jgi:NTP pyrophosphatase (non-canonical NTP hydrolase)
MAQSYRTIELEVIRWAESRGIMAKSDAKTQCLKFASEAGEVCDAVAKGNMPEIVDGVGDTVVTLILLCAKLDIDLVDCLESAYNVIAKRKGKMVNGIFVKEAA